MDILNEDSSSKILTKNYMTQQFDNGSTNNEKK